MSAAKLQLPLNLWLAQITRIPENVLLDFAAMKKIHIKERLGWVATRPTTRPEDRAYCLLGICDVFMPLIYGEGNRAFDRLEEILNKESEGTSTSRISGLRQWMESNRPDPPPTSKRNQRTPNSSEPEISAKPEDNISAPDSPYSWFGVRVRDSSSAQDHGGMPRRVRDNTAIDNMLGAPGNKNPPSASPRQPYTNLPTKGRRRGHRRPENGDHPHGAGLSIKSAADRAQSPPVDGSTSSNRGSAKRKAKKERAETDRLGDLEANFQMLNKATEDMKHDLLQKLDQTTEEMKAKLELMTSSSTLTTTVAKDAPSTPTRETSPAVQTPTHNKESWGHLGHQIPDRSQTMTTESGSLSYRLTLYPVAKEGHDPPSTPSPRTSTHSTPISDRFRSASSRPDVSRNIYVDPVLQSAWRSPDQNDVPGTQPPWTPLSPSFAYNRRQHPASQDFPSMFQTRCAVM